MSKNIGSLIFSFFLSLALLFLSALIILQLKVFDKDSLLSLLNRDYYKAALDNIEKQAYYYTLPTGIDPSVLDEVFTDDELRYNVSHSLTEALAGREFEPVVEQAEQALTDNTHHFLQESGVQLPDDEDAVVSAYVGDIMDIYKQYAVMPGLEYVIQGRTLAGKYIGPGIVVSALAALVLFILIWKMHRYPHHALRYAAYSAGATGIMCGAAAAELLYSGAYRGINLTPEYFYRFVVSLIEQVLKACLFAGVCWLAVMIITICLVFMLRSNAAHAGGKLPLRRRIRRNRHRRGK